MELTVRDVMIRDVATIPVDAPLADAERELLAGGTGELFVQDEAGLVIGVLPDYVLLQFRLTGGTRPETIESLMTRRFLVIGPESRLCVAARYLRDHLHHRLAVVEDRRLVGLLRRIDLLRQCCTGAWEPEGAAA
jgi:CBS domain-containing protein